MMAAPPTRGWTQEIAVTAHHLQGCPAYAGMDPLYFVGGGLL